MAPADLPSAGAIVFLEGVAIRLAAMIKVQWREGGTSSCARAVGWV